MDDLGVDGGLGVAAFNGLMNEFLSQLNTIMGEKEPAIKNACDAFRILARDPKKNRKPMEMFMLKTSPYSEMIENRDELFITKHCKEIPFLKSIHIDSHWIDFDKGQKDAMWEFLNMLLSIGTMLMTIPESMLHMVEKIAGQILDGGSGSEYDPAQILSSMIQEK